VRAQNPMLASCVLTMAVVLSMSVGCRTQFALRDNTLLTTDTLADINYHQVLNNLARFEKNPGAMPSLAVVNAGTVNLADQKSISANATYVPTLTFAQQIGSGLPILSLLFNPSASRNLSENWSLVPVTDVDNLRRIRCAYELLIGCETTDCDHCLDEIKRFYQGEQSDLDCIIPRGWYHVGCKDMVPPRACYVGHYCNTYVWVMPPDVDGLTRFTMTVIDLATGKPHAPTKTVVKTYKADGSLDTTQVTTTEIDKDALKEWRKENQPSERPRQFIDPPTVNPGMFYVPR
jgi:hypothetical protein